MNNCLDVGIFHGIYPLGMHNAGEAMLCSKLYLCTVYGINYSTQAYNFSVTSSLEIYSRHLLSLLIRRLLQPHSCKRTSLVVNVSDGASRCRRFRGPFNQAGQQAWPSPTPPATPPCPLQPTSPTTSASPSAGRLQAFHQTVEHCLLRRRSMMG